MSPVQRSSGHTGRALVVALIGVVVLAAGLWAASLLASNQSSIDVGLGDQTFRGGDVERLAAEIADRGPILYGDVSGSRDRDIILQHLGSDPNEGWHVFLARPANKGRGCYWDWQEKRRLFRASCDHSLTAPRDGAGLTQFPVRVIDGRLDVDLNAEDRERVRPSTSSTTTTIVESGEVPTTTG